MASKMAVVQTLLVVLVGVCVAGGTACPSQCTCSAFRGQPQDLHVDCSGRGLLTIPDLPPNTKSLNLANNALTEIDGQLSSLNLVALNLSGNSIQGLDHRGGYGINNFTGNCILEDFVYNRINHVGSGHWTIMDLTEAAWPCVIDLRNNPISKIKKHAFQGSQNFTLFLGQSASHLTIGSEAFLNTANVIGLHISNVPSLTSEFYWLYKMTNVGWIVIDNTQWAMEGIPILESLKLHWLRISNCNITSLDIGALNVEMDVQTDCYMKTYPYGPSNILTESKSIIHKGGIEFINNSLPVLRSQMFREVGGVYFRGNKIAGFQEKVFALSRRSTNLCIIRFEDNEFETLPSGSFGGLENVVHVSISGGNLASIEENAFADSKNIGSLGISVTGNPDNDKVVIKSKAFAKIGGVKVFSVAGIDGWGNQEVIKPRLLLQPHAFDGLRDVDYMAVNLYENMHTLPDDLFTGLTINQVLTLRVRNLTRIKATAFGGRDMGTRINQLDVTGIQNFPCDCETAKLNANMKVNVRKVGGLTCTGPFPDGTISHAWHLDHATCSASCLQFSLALVILISLFLNF